jgi:hypothetical protein
MYTLVASSPTVVKKSLKQSFELSPQDKQNVLPGKEFFSLNQKQIIILKFALMEKHGLYMRLIGNFM